MNILYLTNSARPGGMEKHVGDLVRAMREGGHNVFVWCPLGEYAEIYKNLGAIHTPERISFDLDPFYINRLVNFIVEKKIDVLHTHELKAGVNGLIAGYLSKCKVRISHLHTPISEWQLPGWKKLLKPLDKFVYTLAVNLFSNVEIALTKSRGKLKESEGIKASKLKVIPNGIDFNEMNIPILQKNDYKNDMRRKHNISDTAFVFGNVGRMTEEKGHELLVRAFSKFLDSAQPNSSNFHLYLAGGGKLEAKINDLVAELGITKQVTVSGIFNDEDKAKFFSILDCFVFPTLAEGFGYVLIEAMYMNLPVLSSDLEVLKEVAGDTILYFQSGNTNDLFEKMVEINKKIILGQYTLAQDARDLIVNNYSYESFKNNYLTLYAELVAKNSGEAK